MIKLETDEARSLVKKYIEEKTPVTCFYVASGIRFKCSGWIDSITSELGLVVRSSSGDFGHFDVSSVTEFQLGDERDVPPGTDYEKGQYHSCLSIALESGAILNLFENA